MASMVLKNGTVVSLEVRDNLPPQVIIIYSSNELARESYHQMLKTYEKMHLITRIEAW